MASLKIGAAYCRVSTEDQDRYGYSLPEQRAEIRRYAREHGIHIATEYEFSDELTGMNLDRPGLNALRALASQGKIGAVVIHVASRLSRKAIDALILREEFVSEGVELHSVEAGRFDPDDNTQRLNWDLRAVIADNDRREILKRMKAGKLRKAKNGEWVGSSRVPLGYQRVYLDAPGHKRGSVLAIDSDGQRIVKLIFKLYTRKNVSLAALATYLNGQGLKSPLGKKWQPSTIARIVANPIYIGRIRYKDITQSFPALATIDRDVFEAAQYRLKRNKELSARSKKHSTLLSGFAFCSCGRRYTIKYGKKSTYYICMAVTKRPFVKIPCDRPMVIMKKLDDLVWTYVLDSITDEALERGVKWRAEHAEQPADRVGDLKRVESDIDRLNKRVATVMSQFDNADDKTMSVISTNIRAMSEEIATLEKRRDELQTAVEVEAATTRGDAEIVDQVREIRGKISRASIEQRRRLMDILHVRCDLIDYDVSARRLRYRVTCALAGPREFDVFKLRHNTH